MPLVFLLKKVISASSYGCFIAEKEFRSQCHIYFVANLKRFLLAAMVPAPNGSPSPVWIPFSKGLHREPPHEKKLLLKLIDIYWYLFVFIWYLFVFISIY